MNIQLIKMGVVCAAMLSAAVAVAEGEPGVEGAPSVSVGAPVVDVLGLVEEAKQLAQRGDYAGALARLEQALHIEPGSPQANYAMGVLRMQLNQPDEGIRYFQLAVQSAPGNHLLHAILGSAFEQARRFGEAMDEYRQVIALAPNTQEAREADRRLRGLQGRQYGAQGDYNAALQVFASILQDYPDDLTALQDIGVTYIALNKWAEAQAPFERLVQLQPDNGMAHRYLGEVMEHQGQGDMAEQRYAQALELLPPENPVARMVKVRLSVLRGVRYLNMGQPRQAQEVFRQALELDPNNLAALFNIATAYHDLEQPLDAEASLKKVLEAMPSSVDAQLRLGVLYVEQNRFDDAAKALEAVRSKADPSSPQAQQAGGYLARIYATPQGREVQNRLRLQRIEEFKALVAQEPDNLAAYKSLAALYHGMGKLEDAVKAYEEVVRLDPANNEAMHNLANVYDDLAQYAKAVAAYSKALNLEKNPEANQQIRGQLLMSLAKKSFADGRMDVAATQFRGILKDKPDDLFAHFFLALILTRQGQNPEAIKEYLEVVRISKGGHVGARVNLATLYEQGDREEDAVTEYQWVVRHAAPGSPMVEFAKTRLESLEKRIGGFSYSLSYSMNFDDNSNLSDANPTPELRTDLSSGITYRRKLVGKPITWGVSVSPGYMTFHYGQFDYLRMDVSPFVSWRWKGANWSGRYSYGELTGVMSEAQVNTSHTVSADATWQLKMPAVLRFMAGEEERANAPSAVRASATWRDFTSESAPIYDSIQFSLGALLNQSLGSGLAWTGSYTFTDNGAKDVRGNDFAYRSHGLSLGFSKSFASQISASMDYGYTYLGYMHPDSSTKFTSTRTNQQHALSLTLSYPIKDTLRVFGTYAYQKNLSNLPTGFILNPQDVNTAIGIQSPSLGDYSHNSLTAGISIGF